VGAQVELEAEETARGTDACVVWVIENVEAEA
jgi:hypothetical protein